MHALENILGVWNWDLFLGEYNALCSSLVILGSSSSSSLLSPMVTTQSNPHPCSTVYCGAKQGCFLGQMDSVRLGLNHNFS